MDFEAIKGNFSSIKLIYLSTVSEKVLKRIRAIGIRGLYENYKLIFKDTHEEASYVGDKELKVFYDKIIDDEVIPTFEGLEKILVLSDNEITFEQKCVAWAYFSRLESLYQALDYYLGACYEFLIQKKKRM
ncbi:hypothetical protein AYK26_01645 [Euryarchaeota archaeon SM23-78]|nr:MAG: hypothetical protein AYK26_01645 [Euryarchaeota archaeon SM23-78]MBW3000482.1 hypothetical protein [Candidatus Woesearchaeota archaeon]